MFGCEGARDLCERKILCDAVNLGEPLTGLLGEEKKSIYNNVVKLIKKHTFVLVDHDNIFYRMITKIIALGEKGDSTGGYLIDAKKYLLQKNRMNLITGILEWVSPPC